MESSGYGYVCFLDIYGVDTVAPGWGLQEWRHALYDGFQNGHILAQGFVHIYIYIYVYI